MDQNRMRQLAGVTHSRPGFDEADTTGEVQKAILGYLKKGAPPVAVTDMVRHPSFRGMHLGRIQKSVEVLAKKGVLKTASDPREGLTVALAEAVLGEDAQVGKTILQQMGGAGRIQAMLGAKNILLLDNGVSFRWPNKERSKGNAVRITLDPSDTYTMEFLNVSGSSAKSVKKYTDVYNDQLVDIFEKQTGWYLSLGGGKKATSGRTPGPEVDPSNVTSKSVASTKHAAGGTFWTVSAIDGTFPTLDAAKKAWFSAGKPKPHGSSVWATEYRGEKTLQTITLNPSMESKLDELRALLGEKKTAKKEGDSEWGETEGCECEEDDDECECAEEAREFSQDQLAEMAAPKSRKLLWAFLKDLQAQEVGPKLVKLPASEKNFADETFGKQSFVFFSWISPEARREGESLLKDAGFKVDSKYWPGSATSSVQVSYFKGWHHDEERESDAMEAVQGYSLPFYARTETSDGEQWFRATGNLKNGGWSGMMLDAGAAGRSSSKAKKSTLDAKWAKQSWDEVEPDDVPPRIKAALGEAEEAEGAHEVGVLGEEDAPLGFKAKPVKVLVRKVEKDSQSAGLQFVFAGRVYDAYAKDHLYSVAPGLEVSTDILLKNGYSEDEVAAIYKDARSGPVELEKPVKIKTTVFVRKDYNEADEVEGSEGKSDMLELDGRNAALDELLRSVRSIVEGQTYAKAQADIVAGLEKDGWKVKKTGPDGKPMKVPHATSPNGDFKLFFKAQAIYKTHGQGDLGNARSLHLPDIRKSTYADFGAALSRWTGQDTKGNPLPKKGSVATQPGDWDKAVALVKSDPKHQMTPDQYHQKHGECPDGYHFDGSSKRCVKTKTEASEMQRLAGINRYPDRTLSEGAPVPRSMTAMVGEIRKYATGSLHPDWVVADEAADEEDRTDLWHPDKDVKNPGLPMDKAKSAAPADKGSALLKALKCPPGKEAKLVFGRPSCAPIAKS